jgi:VIT1/CCC1 family predicted Fe2+/Mn2+ transporter
LAGLLAGALSMAAGEYISVRSQRELLEAASQELDRPTLRALADQEAEELGLVFRARGMAVDQAERRAAALRAGGDDQPAGGDGDAGTDAAGTDVVGLAVGAAGFSFVSFAAGAAIPILPFLVTTGTAAILAAAIVVGVALFATGATVGVLTGGSLLGRGLRQLGIGAVAALVTYGLGRLFNTIVDHRRLTAGCLRALQWSYCRPEVGPSGGSQVCYGPAPSEREAVLPPPTAPDRHRRRRRTGLGLAQADLGTAGYDVSKVNVLSGRQGAMLLDPTGVRRGGHHLLHFRRWTIEEVR